MPLTLYTYNDFLNAMQTALANGAPQITNFRSGSIALALSQAVAGNSIALEQILLEIYATERLATSFGADVDSFVNDFGLTRDPASFAYDYIQMNRTATGTTLSIPLGALVQNPNTGVQYELIADDTNSAYDPTSQTYIFQNSDAFIAGTFQATTLGTAGNTPVNTITQIVSGLTGVTSVSNLVAFDNGTNIETDLALKQRFVLFIGGLRTSNIASVSEAIESVSTAVTYQIYEYFHFDGTPWPAGFTIIADDGSGDPPSSFLQAIQTAVDAIRAAGAEFAVSAPTIVGVTVSVHIVATSGTSLGYLQAQLQTAVLNYIHGLGVGVTCSYIGIANVLEQFPGVFAATGILLNGEVGDVTISQTELAQYDAVTFT